VAKEGSDKATVLKFYKFMLSDDVLDLYIRGLYTSAPKLTYMLPPKINYMKKMAHEDHIYRQISKEAYQKSKPYPHYRP
jgi:hypothetical protein